MKEKYFTPYRVSLIGMMAALVCVVTFFRFPLLGSKVHFANAMCLLSGLLLGGAGGGLAAGIGSALYDGLFGGYDVFQCLITLGSKFLMAFFCAKIAQTQRESGRVRLVAGCVVGSLSYVALYMLKTFVYQRFVYGYPPETVWAAMLGKLPASLINAVFAMVAAPLLYWGLKPALKKAGVLEKLEAV